MSAGKPKILVLTDFYLPGYKSGALRTIVNMVERLSDEFDFWILTRNHDSDGDASRYREIKLHEWQQVGDANVFYTDAEWINLGNLEKLLNEISPDAVYLNSFFSPLSIKFLTLRRLKRIKNIPVVLAPEGEFSAGALKLKAAKKQLFLKTAIPFGLYGNLIWKAAAEAEREDIRRIIGNKTDIFVAANMPPRAILPDYRQERKPEKKPGAVRLVFLSRVSPKKNLSFALDLLRKTEGEVLLDIFGSLEDDAYWQECQKIIRELPQNIKVLHHGSVAHEQVAETFSRYHFFFFPTLGENFGHVVIEALAAGSPVILSDQTPWRNLTEKKAGWDLQLRAKDQWLSTLKKCVGMSAKEYRDWSASARKYAVEWLAAREIESDNRAVLRRATEKV